MKKNIIYGILVVVVLFIMWGGLQVKSEEQNITVAPVIQEIMEEEGLSNCYLKKMSDYSNISVYLETPTVSDSELKKYVQENTEDDSVESDAVIKQKLIEQKKIQAISNARDEIMERLISLGEFNLDDDEIVNYSQQIIESYEAEAYLYNCTLEEYIENYLNISYSEFFSNCYVEGETMVKKYIILGAIYQTEFANDALEGDDIYLRYQDMENKVYSLFIQTDNDF